ncbi:MAG: hypothetical protein LBI82_06485 [Dysgonamonadaceae bacterium]|jgi:hypothetical protein|nr:hypothetical protein [Dysgonamonadaceae bacterium]
MELRKYNGGLKREYREEQGLEYSRQTRNLSKYALIIACFSIIISLGAFIVVILTYIK